MAGANFKSFLNKYREKTGSNSVMESRYGEPGYWISTGSMALNRICSGSIKKGIPSGRITVLAGESSVGKSLIAATLIANAQKDGCQHVFYFDSEGGAGRQFFENAGCDPESIEQILVENVEDAEIKILDTFNMIMEYKEKDPEARFLCVLDSLGALVASKLLTDAQKGKVAQDMGSRAKLCLPGEYEVLMCDGIYKMIKDIKPGDEVITHLGRSRKVLDNIKSSHKKVVKLKLKINDEIKEFKMSLNHKMIVKRGNDILEIPACELTKEDKLLKLNLD